ncbi:MAG: SRPBCC family protein [Ignavibacteriaceae bacterium]|nr:SRPBCC family protein [Ignavibacteriaceae bacterium]
MKIYQFKTSQFLPITIEKAWEFFSNPNNLPKITPPWLNFKVTSQPQNKMYAGMIITYLVRPMLNIPTTWVTEITHVNAPHYFVDEQRFGPYKFWHHQHIFREANNGIEMEDIVSYAVPFGLAGWLLNKILIEKKIIEIFSFRSKALEKIF